MELRHLFDYAHNGDSLNKLLQVVTSHQDGCISLILGAPGNKGESRRKDFGHVLNTYPDVDVILTADDPNKEDPLAICQEIASHISREVRIIVDREELLKQQCLRLQTPKTLWLSLVKVPMPSRS